jgi:predicted AlkP superfamily phosphohydrolase/phosphomutase
MFGTKRRKALADRKRNVEIRAMMSLHPDKLAGLVLAKDPGVADMAQAVIVVKWLVEHGYLPAEETDEENSINQGKQEK